MRNVHNQTYQPLRQMAIAYLRNGQTTQGQNKIQRQIILLTSAIKSCKNAQYDEGATKLFNRSFTTHKEVRKKWTESFWVFSRLKTEHYCNSSQLGQKVVHLPRLYKHFTELRHNQPVSSRGFTIC